MVKQSGYQRVKDGINKTVERLTTNKRIFQYTFLQNVFLALSDH